MLALQRQDWERCARDQGRLYTVTQRRTAMTPIPPITMSTGATGAWGEPPCSSKLSTLMSSPQRVR